MKTNSDPKKPSQIQKPTGNLPATVSELSAWAYDAGVCSFTCKTLLEYWR